MKPIFFFVACTILATAAEAQVTVSDQIAPIPIAEDFNTYTTSEASGILVVPGARIAEDCIGQTTVKIGGVEVTTGTPTNPPTPNIPPPQDGAYTTVINALGSVSGMAEGGTLDEIGEGALTIVYDDGQPEIGMRITNSNPGSGIARFQLFDSFGAHIATLEVPSFPDRDITISSPAVSIRAVTFTNSGDFQGLALDDLRHFVIGISGPTTFCFGDGSFDGTPCPCGNVGQQDHGCGNGTFASGARLTHTAAGGIEVRNATPNQPVLFFRGQSAVFGGNGIGEVFGDGLRCVGNAVLRVGILQTDGVGTATLATLPPPGVGNDYFQAWYRDPALSPCGAKFNLSNALAMP